MALLASIASGEHSRHALGLGRHGQFGLEPGIAATTLAIGILRYEVQAAGLSGNCRPFHRFVRVRLPAP